MALGAIIWRGTGRCRPTTEEECAMSQPRPEPAPTAADEPETPTTEALVDEELLVEDVSIDGMCGVY
jgi:mycofactocin precursor